MNFKTPPRGAISQSVNRSLFIAPAVIKDALFRCHFNLNQNQRRYSNSVVRVTDTHQCRPVIGQSFTKVILQYLSTVLNLLHCRAGWPPGPLCYHQIQLTAHPEPCRASSHTAAYQQLQFSTFCLPKLSSNVAHIQGPKKYVVT